MKVICNRAAFLEALTITALAVPSRSPKPVLQSIKLSASDGRLTLEATDLEVAIHFQTAQVQIESEGATLVPADKLIAIVRESQDDTISLKVEGNEAEIKGSDSVFKIFTQSPSDFPPVPSFDGQGDIEVAAGVLKQLIGQTLFAAAKEGTRYAFHGVLTAIKDKQLQLVATDGRRMAIAHGDVIAVNIDQMPRSIIPAKALNMVEKLLTDAEATIQIKLSENQAIFSTPDATLTTNLVEGSFPPYDDVIPKDTDKKMTAGTADFLSAVRRAALLTSDDSKGVRMDFASSKGLVLSSRNPESGEATVNFACKYDGKDIAIGFNPTFLSDALKIVDVDEVTFEMAAPNRPGLLRGGDRFAYVIMPVNLQ